MRNRFGITMLVVAAIALVAFASTPKVHAEDYSSTKIFTNQTFGASQTTTVNYPIDLRKYKEVSLEFLSTLHDAGTGSITINGVKSVDGVNFESSPSFSWTFLANGTTTNSVVTNCNFGAVGTLKINQIINGNTSSVDSATLFLGKKTRQFGNELN